MEIAIEALGIKIVPSANKIAATVEIDFALLLNWDIKPLGIGMPYRGFFQKFEFLTDPNGKETVEEFGSNFKLRDGNIAWFFVYLNTLIKRDQLWNKNYQGVKPLNTGKRW